MVSEAEVQVLKLDVVDPPRRGILGRTLATLGADAERLGVSRWGGLLAFTGEVGDRDLHACTVVVCHCRLRWDASSQSNDGQGRNGLMQ